MAVPTFVRASSFSFFTGNTNKSFDATGVDYLLIGMKNFSGPGITAASFDGNAFTQLSEYTPPITTRPIDVWGCVIPVGSRGTHNIVFSQGGNDTVYATAAGFAGVHATTSIGAIDNEEKTTFGGNVTFEITTTGTDSLVVGVLLDQGSNAASVVSPLVYVGGYPEFVYQPAATAGVQFLTLNPNDTFYAGMVSVELLTAGGGGGGGRATKNTRPHPLGTRLGVRRGISGPFYGPMARHGFGIFVPERLAA